MLDSKLRPFYQRLFIQPVLTLSWVTNVSPIKITAVACCFGLFIAPLLFFHAEVLAVLCMLISGYFDTLDGSLARHQKTASALGTVFDITSDRFVEFSVIFGLFLYDPTIRGLPCLMMLGSVLLCVTSFLVVGIFSQNQSEKSFHYSPGFIERAEAFIFWAIMILLPESFFIFSCIFSVLVFLTTLVRLFQFSKQIALPRER